jgi:hypothetical protein
MLLDKDADIFDQLIYEVWFRNIIDPKKVSIISNSTA